MKLSSLIISPIMSEKSLKQQDESVYSFWVKKSAIKGQIKTIIESTFKVKVLKVRLGHKGSQAKKNWRQGNTYILPAQKKAYVKIASDQKIDLLKGK